MDVKFKDGDRTYMSPVPYLLPEDILQYLISDCGLTIDEDLCKQFWEHLEAVEEEVAVTSKVFRALDSRQVWPLGIHGDDATMGLNNAPYDKILGVFLSLPLFRPRSTRISRYLLFALELSKVNDVESTVNPILERIVNSINRCTETGVAGRRMILTELRGDQAWFRFLLNHASWWKTVHICFRCSASTRPDHLNYANYDGWIATKRTTRQFIVDELPMEMSCLIVKNQKFFDQCSNHSSIECGSTGIGKNLIGQCGCLFGGRCRNTFVLKHNPGPLVGLHFFSISSIKHCSLHVLNLGLLHISNGSTMNPICT